MISSKAWIFINKPLQRKIRRALDALECEDPFVGVAAESKELAVEKIMKLIFKHERTNPFNK